MRTLVSSVIFTLCVVPLLSGCGASGGSDATPVLSAPSNPGGGGGAPVPQSTIWHLVIDGEGDQFAMGSVIGDGGFNIAGATPPTLIPIGTQFSIDYNVVGGFTILGVSRSSGVNAMLVQLFRDGVLVESGIIGSNGAFYSFQQY